MTLPEELVACERREGAGERAIHQAERGLGGPLPDDYRAILAHSDGLEGFIGPDAYLSLWSIADVVSLNQAYSVGEFVPGVVLLGTDGGDTGHGFRRVDGRVEYVSVPLVGMSPRAVVVLGETFAAALARLVNGGAG